MHICFTVHREVEADVDSISVYNITSQTNYTYKKFAKQIVFFDMKSLRKK